jgi:hypothetical protein
MTDRSPELILKARAAQLAEWLENEAPYVQFDQHHLDAGTIEQAYWHLGYRAALQDVLAMLKGETAGNAGTSNHSPEGDPDA